MKLMLNGQERECSDVCTVRDLVAALGLERTPCAVEVNGTLVKRQAHEAQPLQDGDRVEVVTLVGGG